MKIEDALKYARVWIRQSGLVKVTITGRVSFRQGQQCFFKEIEHVWSTEVTTVRRVRQSLFAEVRSLGEVRFAKVNNAYPRRSRMCGVCRSSQSGFLDASSDGSIVGH